MNVCPHGNFGDEDSSTLGARPLGRSREAPIHARLRSIAGASAAHPCIKIIRGALFKQQSIDAEDDRAFAAARALFYINRHSQCCHQTKIAVTMGRIAVCESSITTLKVAKVAKQPSLSSHAKPHLKAFKLWCLKKCSRLHSSSESSYSPSHPNRGPAQVVVPATTATQKLAWMRDGDLDATIWKNLPEEVLEHIFALLPFPNLFRCATICKQWRTIAQSPHLRLVRASSIVTPWPSYCLIRYSQRESGALHWSGFCTNTNKWQDMPRICIPSSPGKCVIAGSGGLLVIYKPGTILVCNPITGQQRELPRTNQNWSWPNVLHMVTDDDQGSYMIILAGTEAYSTRKLQATEVYNSATDKWVVTGSLPAGLCLDTQDAAFDNGLLYCTAQKAYMQAADNVVGTDALVAFDIRRGVWSEVASEFPDDSARQTPLVCGGRIVMAVAPVDDDGPVGCFYALNAVSKHWELIASMPEVMHGRVRPWGVCVVSGNDIVVVSDSAQGCVVSYDMAWGTWCERKAPIKFTKSNRPSAKEVPLLASVSFRPDVNATP